MANIRRRTPTGRFSRVDNENDEPVKFLSVCNLTHEVRFHIGRYEVVLSREELQRISDFGLDSGN